MRTWGTMREVMHDGRTEGKVSISDAAASPHSVGIGALAGLAGEIAIIDGDVWISRATAPPRIETTHGCSAGDRAALLAVTNVTSWNEIAIDRDVAPGELDSLLNSFAERNGLARCETFPFVIRGDFDDLDAHVLNGRCPYAGPGSSETDPVRAQTKSASGRLVGFFTRLEPGILTHHGSQTHVHVLLEGDTPFVGHVDAVRIRKGATLRLPAAR